MTRYANMEKKSYKKAKKYSKKNKMYITRSLRSSENQVHRIRRISYTSQFPSISNLNTDPYIGNLAFQLNSVPNVNEFVSLFDYYRITSIMVRVIPKFNTNSINTSIISQPTPTNNEFFLPRVISAIYSTVDTIQATPALTDIAQYPTYKSSQGNREHVRMIYWPTPALTSTTPTGGSNTNFLKPLKKQWISTKQNTVNHYGLFLGIENPFPLTASPATLTIYFDTEYTFNLEFKGIH